MKLIKGFGHGAFLWDKDMSYFDEVVDIQGVIDYLLKDTEAPTLIVLDACRTSPISDGSKGEGTTQAGLAPLQVPTGAVIAYSAQAGKKAYDGTGNNSLYAMSFAKHIMTEDLNHNDLFRRIRGDVELASKERVCCEVHAAVVDGLISLVALTSSKTFKSSIFFPPDENICPFTDRSPIITKLPSIGAILLKEASGTINCVLIETSL